MADPITAEQVARAIEAARSDEGGISDALGGWQWDKRAPDYVRVAWGKPSLPDFIAALTRWHAELVAAETPRKAPDDTAPERLRERREALGWNQTWAAEDINRLHGFTEDPWGWRCVASCEEGSASAIDRARYAAALSAAEAERAAKPDHLAYADSPVWDDGPLPTPTPERPAPRFKVGDWVRVVTDPNSAGRINPIRVTCVTSAGYIMADGASWAAEHLTPALDPALRETARKTVAWLRGGARGTGPADFTTLPGWSDWNSGSRWDAAEHWAAQLERLLGDAP